MHVTFKAKKKELKKAISIVNFKNKRIISDGMMRISVLPDAVEFFNHGVSHKVAAETEGLADVIMPDDLLQVYLDSLNLPIVSFTFKQGQIICGSSIRETPAIRLETFMTTKESPLPVNADDFTILKCCHNRELTWLLEFDLANSYKSVQGRMNYNIHKAIEILQPYKVTASDLKEIINRRIEESIK